MLLSLRSSPVHHDEPRRLPHPLADNGALAAPGSRRAGPDGAVRTVPVSAGRRVHRSQSGRHEAPRHRGVRAGKRGHVCPAHSIPAIEHRHEAAATRGRNAADSGAAAAALGAGLAF